MGTDGERVYRSVIRSGKALLRALRLTVRSAGQEHVPTRGPVVLASNHASFPDFLFIGQALLDHRLVRFMCRADIWDAPLPGKPVGRGMEAMRHIPVDRAAPAAAYLRGRSLLREGEAVCVFPEGGISTAYVVRALMPGAVALARETGAPLVPVTLWGSQRIWAQKQGPDAPFPKPNLTRGRLVDVRFHAPITVASDADVAETSRVLGARLQEGLEELQGLPEHRPRPGEFAPWYPAHLGGHARDRESSFLLDGMPRSAITPTWGPGLSA